MKDALGHGSNPRGSTGLQRGDRVTLKKRAPTLHGTVQLRGVVDHIHPDDRHEVKITTPGAYERSTYTVGAHEIEAHGVTNGQAAQALAAGSTKSDTPPVHNGASGRRDYLSADDKAEMRANNSAPHQKAGAAKLAGKLESGGFTSGGRHGYNPTSVNQAIESSNRSGRRIGGKEARAIHALLKGRG